MKPTPMPKGIKIYNGSYEPCDMMIGPCCCGAWHDIEQVHKVILYQVKQMTYEEKMQSLIDAGILTKSGKLSKRYKS